MCQPDVVVVDRVNHHLFQPLLYQVATAVLSPGDIAPALRAVLREQGNARVLLGEAVDVDASAKSVEVRLADGSRRIVEYDTLVVAAGATASYFGHDGWQRVAPPMKSLADAVKLRARLLSAFENASNADDPAERKGWLTFAVVGAGPTGVELAGQIAAMSRRSLQGQFAGLEAGQVRIVLIDAGTSVLPPFAAPLRKHTHTALQRLGVDVRLGQQVVTIDEAGVTTTSSDSDDAQSEQHIPARTVIWAAGVAPSQLTAALATATGAQLDGKGRVLVEPDCSLPGNPDVFAIGDMVNLDDLPGLAEPAIQEGRHVAKVIGSRVTGQPSPGAFRYRDLGTMATISPRDAVADIRGVHLHGLLGKFAWAVVHLASSSAGVAVPRCSPTGRGRCPPAAGCSRSSWSQSKTTAWTISIHRDADAPVDASRAAGPAEGSRSPCRH